MGAQAENRIEPGDAAIALQRLSQGGRSVCQFLCFVLSRIDWNKPHLTSFNLGRQGEQIALVPGDFARPRYSSNAPAKQQVSLASRAPSAYL